uniref:Integrase catalytic domain-containing protein n=1 Tax=Trichuris muris TaxID=70415 RepID=A0A5S6R310_TRIMR
MEPTDAEDVPKEDLEIVHSTRYTSTYDAATEDVILQLIYRTSRIRHLLRVVAWLRRAANRFRLKTNTCPVGVISVKELSDAWRTCVKSVQSQCFHTEMDCLKRHLPLPQNSRLRRLDPFMDACGIVRVSGRLHLSHLPHEAKHPPILPSGHYFAVMVIEEAHNDRGHSGVEDTLVEVRARAWIINSRALVRSVLAKCIACRKQIGTPSRIPFAWLPSFRVQRPLNVFAYTGLDYFGPFFVSVRRSTVKRWVCLFTCLTVRAVHLEVCHSLDVDSFLAAFRRFTARRGTPAMCISDNGTNFVAGDRTLRKGVENLNNSQVKEFMAKKNIEWHFNPPGATQFGGCWDRLIACAKRAMNTVLKGRSVPEEVFETVVVQVEGLLNGRPLTHVSSDAKDFEPLTPNHFLLGRPYASIPPDLFNEDRRISRRRWETCRILVNQFWRRWMREYLPFLASSSKRPLMTDQIQEGDVVLIVDVNNPRGVWPLRRVTRTYPGQDGIVRVVDVSSSGKTLRRPVARMIKLTSLMSVPARSAGEDVVA